MTPSNTKFTLWIKANKDPEILNFDQRTFPQGTIFEFCEEVWVVVAWDDSEEANVLNLQNGVMSMFQPDRHYKYKYVTKVTYET